MGNEMTQTQHTPGPWMVDVESRPHSGGKYRPDFWFVTAADGSSFAKVEAWPDSNQRVEAEANARLIAAAPELLAALLGAECAVEQLCIGQDPANQCWVTLAEIRAAKAKARGA